MSTEVAKKSGSGYAWLVMVGFGMVMCATIGAITVMGGGGFPGVPLALESGRKTVLVDSVQKKMAIVGSVLSELGMLARFGVRVVH